MNETFKRFLDDATRLTRTGDLGAATEAIQQALGSGGGHGTPATPSPPRRPVRDDRATDGDAAAAESVRARDGRGDATRADPTIIDGNWWRSDGEAASDPAPRGRATGDVGSDAAGTVSRARHDGRAGALDYRLFVPPLAAGAPAPALIVMLHGCTQSADDFARGTRMDALALAHGFLVLYPEQAGNANPQRCWNWFKHVHQRRGRGEPGVIEETVRAIVDVHGVDPARVFVAGLSAGGAMAAILGDVCPELFAAVGVHSGLAAGAAQDLPGALAAMRGGQNGQGVPLRASAPGPATHQPPTIVFHGDADRTVHPDNGERVVTACLDGALETSRDVATPERREGRTGDRGWTRRVHRDARGEVVAEHWLVHGAGHAWSGGDGRGTYADATGPDASAEMVRFFLAVRDSRG